MRGIGAIMLLAAILFARPAAAVELERCRMVAEGTASIVSFPAQRHDGEAIRLDGVLARPAGPGPFPAIVMVHGSSGLLTPFCYAAVVRQFVDSGHVVLIPAGSTAQGRDGAPLLDYSFLDQIEYARAAAAALAVRPDVDPDRLGLWGHSRGGLTLLHGVASREAPLTAPFRAAVAAAPTCPARAAPPGIPLLLVIGANDRDVSVQACKDLAVQLENSSRFRLLFLPRSGHAFWAAGAPGSNASEAASSREAIDAFFARHLSAARR